MGRAGLPLTAGLGLLYAALAAAAAPEWPGFRGPNASGIGAGTAPASFDVPASRGVLWKTPVPGLGHSSPVVAGEEEGDVHVVKAGPEFELLGTSRLGELTLATPAIAGGVMYFRTRSHLVAVGSPPARAQR